MSSELADKCKWCDGYGVGGVGSPLEEEPPCSYCAGTGLAIVAEFVSLTAANALAISELQAQIKQFREQIAGDLRAVLPWIELTGASTAAQEAFPRLRAIAKEAI